MIIDFSNKELFNNVYFSFFKTKKRYIFLMGSAGSGKSVSIAQDLVMKSFLKGNRTLCTRKTKESIKDSVYQELLNVIDNWNLREHFTITKSPLYIKNNLSDADFLFRGIDDVEKLKSISKINTIWIEEATELSNREIYDQLDLRLRGKNKNGYRLIVSFNPVDGQHWLNTDFWSKGEDENTMLLHTTYLDNRFVGEEYKRVMDRIKIDNPSYYKIYGLGEWGVLKGLIFNNWGIIKEIPEEAELLGYGQDFGYTNDPTTIVGIYKYNGGVIFDEKLYRKGMTNTEIVKFWKEECDISKLVYADSSDPGKIAELKLLGMKIEGVKKGPNSIVNGLTEMQNVRILITGYSVNMLKEFRKYTWKEDKNGKTLNEPIGGDDHLIDGCRYAFVSFIGYKKKPKIGPGILRRGRRLNIPLSI